VATEDNRGQQKTAEDTREQEKKAEDALPAFYRFRCPLLSSAVLCCLCCPLLSSTVLSVLSALSSAVSGGSSVPSAVVCCPMLSYADFC
jgi:hypothetical protein